MKRHAPFGVYLGGACAWNLNGAILAQAGQDDPSLPKY